MPIIDGHQITISNPDKVMFPADGITKGDLVEYYQRVAERMLPHVRGRPLHMNRFPDGIGRIAIQQKRIPDSFPQWIKRATVDLHRGGTITHAVIDNAATLVYLANYNMITAHVWLSRIEAPEQPDQLIFDLDPSDDDFRLVRKTALSLKTLLEELRLVAFVKTTGSRGLHVVVPISVAPHFEDVPVFADFVAQRLTASHHHHLTTESITPKRKSPGALRPLKGLQPRATLCPYAPDSAPATGDRNRVALALDDAPPSGDCGRLPDSGSHRAHRPTRHHPRGRRRISLLTHLL